jgi:hypothetical protein
LLKIGGMEVAGMMAGYLGELRSNLLVTVHKDLKTIVS